MFSRYTSLTTHKNWRSWIVRSARKKNKLGKLSASLRSNFAVIASKVDSLLRPFGDQELEHSKALQKKLQADLPISCRQESRHRHSQGLNLLAVSRPTRDRVYDVFRNLMKHRL